MAQNYTTAEIEAAVLKLVRDSIRRPYGTLGNRDLQSSFSDTVDAAAGVYILTPNAPFYTLFLGVQRLIGATAVLESGVSDLIDCIEAMGRRVRPVESVTSLGNARAALFALEHAALSRQSTFQDIEQAPAFQRFDSNTERFLSDSGNNIRVNGAIVQTPQQARLRLSTVLSEVTESYTDVLRRVRLLAVAIDDFNSLNLPSALSQGVITRAREVLSERLEELEGLTPEQRLEVLRDVTLDVLAGKAAVRGFGSLSPRGTFVVINGSGSVYADVDHPALAATATSDQRDPYTIVAGADELLITVDGGPLLTIPVQRSYVSKLEGLAAEPFNIYGSGNAPPLGVAVNDKLRVQLEGFPDLDVTFTKGNNRTIEQIVTNINAAVTTQPLVAEPYFNPEKFVGICDTDNATPTTLDFIRTVGPWADVSVFVGDYIQVTDPLSSMYLGLFEITSITTNVASTTALGAVVPADEVGRTVSVGPPDRFLRIRITDAGTVDAVDNSRLLSTPAVTNGANDTLGLIAGMAIRSRRTRADEVALGVNTSFQASAAGVARVSAAASFASLGTLSARSEPTDPLRLVLFRLRAEASVTAGTSVVFTVAGALAAGVLVGDRVVLRSAAVVGEVGILGTVTARTDTTVNATMVSPVTATTGIQIEIGPNLSLARDTVVRVEGSPNEGDYRTTTVQTVPFEVLLDRVLVSFIGIGGQPVFFTASWGGFKVAFSSLNTTTSSALSIAGTAASKFFTTVPKAVVGSTPYVKLPESPKALEVGDVLEVYKTSYNLPSETHDIESLELSQQLIQLETNLANDVGALNFSTTTTIPFARIRKAKKAEYDVMQASLQTWLTLPANQDGYFPELNRLLNPVIANTNPTLSAANSAKIQAQQMATAADQLLTILGSYRSSVEPRVDTLLSSFMDRGANRAVDTLLEGRFSEFFGYNNDEVSYLGTATSQMRDVARLDLPVRRIEREASRAEEMTIGEFEEPDFEFDQSDIQDVDEPDIPGQFLSVTGGSQ